MNSARAQLKMARDLLKAAREERTSLEPLRVLHFLCTPVRAGVGEHALSLLMELRSYGFIPYMIAPQPLLDAVRSELRGCAIQSTAIDMSSPLDWREIWHLSSILRRERIDIVHCHMAIASFCAAPTARLSGVPTVIETTHGREIWRENKTIKGSYWFDRQIGRLIDRFIAVSDAVSRHLLENKRMPAHKVTVIRNGRDLSQFRPATRRQGAAARAAFGLTDEPTIVMIARFSVEKGHALLIDALRLIAARWPRLAVVLAGDGPLEEEIKAQCERYGLGDNVRFLGYRSDTEKLLAAADVVALPSKVEGLPLVAVEALAAARPLVATAVGGTPEVVVNGETGILVPPDDPAAFGKALDMLLSEPELRTRLGACGRKLAEKCFDVRTQIRRTVDLYRELSRARRTFLRFPKVVDRARQAGSDMVH
jgi:glycosyltransferase involved in cell wall biosynthesis